MTKNFTDVKAEQMIIKSNNLGSGYFEASGSIFCRISIILFFCLFYLPSIFSQDFMMQGWYWDYPKSGCNNYVGPSIAADMAARAEAQKNAGFTMMWMPPLAKASFGNCSNGYDPQDLYDYGQVTGQTGLGTGSEVEAWIAALTANNIFPIADVVYNHRDGGQWEDNPAARSYILNYPNGGGCGGFPATPYPVNGKLRYRIPLGGSSNNGAGDYYFKFSSASGNAGFNGRPYKLFFRTQNTGFINMPINEVEPNGGGDCGQGNNQIFLGRDIFATEEVGGCNTDEFYLQIQSGDFLAGGDFLEIYIEEVGGGGSGIDQRIYGIWSASRSMDIMADLAVQTRTDYSTLPSGQGAMSYRNFKPNGTNPTCMVGDEEFPFFFFDVEQAYNGSNGGQSTRQVYDGWNKWLWNTVGIRGFRMDAVKHFPPSFVGQLLNDLNAANINPPMVVGEHFTSDAFVLKNWIDGVYSAMNPSASSAIQVRAFDFELRQALKNACDNGLYDARNIFNSGLVDRAGMSGLNAVTFVNNHDYRTVGEHILNRQMLAYAYILTNNKIGLPSVFHPDYYGIDIYGQENPLDEQADAINELMQIHKTYITGAGFVDYLNRTGTPYGSNYQQSGAFDHLLYQIQGGAGGKDVIVVINFENQSLRFNHTINTANAPLGTPFTLVAGNADFTTPVVENNMFNGLPNSLYFDIPAYSYAVFVQGQPFVTCYADMDGDGIGDPNSAQVFEGTCGLNFTDNALDCDDTVFNATSGVVPGDFESVSGGGAFFGPLANEARTYQLVIHEDQLTSLLNNDLMSLSFRLPATAIFDFPFNDITFGSFDIYLSASNAPANMSSTFDANIIGTKVQVRSGSLFIPAGSFSSGNDPNDFGVKIAFDTVYQYTGGHLLVEMRHTGFGGSQFGADAIPISNSEFGIQFNSYWKDEYDGTTGTPASFSIILFNGNNCNVPPCNEISPPAFDIVDVECPNDGGSINAVGCGEGTEVQYALSNEGPWTTTAPAYTNDSITIFARCMETSTGCSSVIVQDSTSPAKDSNPPTAICNNLTVVFSGENQIQLFADELFTADDDCALQDTLISNQMINCNQIGMNIPITVTVTDESNNTATCISNIEVTGLPCAWSQNINGINCPEGSNATFNDTSNIWTLTSTHCSYGSPFNSDEMAFVQQSLCGNGSIIAQVTGLNGGLGWAGVIMRETNDAGAKKAQLTTNFSGNFHRREFRINTNGTAFPQQISALNKYWLRIDRSGNQFTLYSSANGLTWSFLGAQTILMNACIEAGLVLSNYSQDDIVSATFANVTLIGSGFSKPAPSDFREMSEVKNISFFPNPSSGTFYIDLKDFEPGLIDIQILNIHGQLIENRSIDSQKHSEAVFDFSDQAAGMYFLKVSSNFGEEFAGKLILVR